MADENITRLNELIADLNTAEIISHVEDGTLSAWLDSVKMEFSVVSIKLYIDICKYKGDKIDLQSNNQQKQQSISN